MTRFGLCLVLILVQEFAETMFGQDLVRVQTSCECYKFLFPVIWDMDPRNIISGIWTWVDLISFYVFQNIILTLQE